MRTFADAAVCGDIDEERHKAVVTDPLIGRNESDTVAHSFAHRRRPFGADDTVTLGLTLTHRLPPSQRLQLSTLA